MRGERSSTTNEKQTPQIKAAKTRALPQLIGILNNGALLFAPSAFPALESQPEKVTSHPLAGPLSASQHGKH